MPTAAELITKIEVHGVDKYSRDMRKVEQDTNKAASDMDSAGKKAGGFGASLASIGGTAALGGIAAIGVGLGGAIKVAGDFEASLNGVSAATGATSDQMKLMREEALKIGADTSKGASEAVEAMGELTKSGVSVQDAVGGVARTVVQMSEASGSSVANMATLMSDSLNVFNLGADQAGDTANTLVKAAGASSISIDDLAQSLSAGGLVAKNAGLSIGDFSAAIGILGNQGLKSSDAGTSLKAMIAGLTPTTLAAKGIFEELSLEVFDAEGKFKSFDEILGTLAQGFAGLTEEQRAQKAETLFGSDGIRAFNALIPDTASGMADAVTQFQQFNQAMGEAPSVAEQSQKRMQGLGGEMEKLKGSLETIAIEVGTVLLPALTQAAAFLAENIGPAFETLQKHAGTILPVLGAVAGVLGGLLVASTVAGAITTLVGAWTALSAAMGAVGPITAIVAILGGPLTLAIVGIGAAIAVLVLAWTQNWGDIQGKTEAVINAVRPILDGLAGRLSEFGEVILPELSAAWQQTSENIGTVVNAIRDVVEPIFDGIRDFLNAHSTEITAILQGAWDAISTIVTTVTGVISNTIQFWLNVLQGDWSGAWENVKNIVSITWDGIKQLTEIFLSTILPNVITLGKAAVVTVWNAFWDELKASVHTMIHGENGLLAIMRALPGQILEAVGKLGTLLFQAGKDLIQGIIDGGWTVDLWGALKEIVANGIKGAWEAIRPGSPSREGADIGRSFIQGIIDGAGELGRELKDYIAGLVGGALGAARDVAGGALGAIGGAASGALGAIGIGGGGGGDWAQVAGAVANQYGLPPALIAAMAFHESGGGNLFAEGDSGQSHGLFQVHTPAHGGSRETWVGTEGAFRGAAVMSGRWIQAFNALGGIAAFNADPVGFYMRFQPMAQGSVPISRAHAEAAIAAARRAGYARGGTVRDGWFTVGERGFELGHLGPDGLRIFSNEQSKALLSGMSGVPEYQSGAGVTLSTTEIGGGRYAVGLGAGGGTATAVLTQDQLWHLIRAVEALNQRVRSGGHDLSAYDEWLQNLLAGLSALNRGELGQFDHNFQLIEKTLGTIPPLIGDGILPVLGGMTESLGTIPPLISGGVLPPLKGLTTELGGTEEAAAGVPPVLDEMGDAARTVATGPTDQLKEALSALSGLFEKAIGIIARLVESLGTIGPASEKAADQVKEVVDEAGKIPPLISNGQLLPLLSTTTAGTATIPGLLGSGQPLPPLRGLAAGGRHTRGWFMVGEEGFELGHLGPDGMMILPHGISKSLLSGMSGGARIPGFAAGTNPATAPAKSNMRLAEAASALATYGPITPELAAALAEITQMQLDYFSAQAEYLESVRSDKVGRGIAAEVRRFLQWAVANNKQYLLSVADEQGPEAAYEAYHGTGAIDRLWAKYRGTRGDPFAAAVMGAYGIGGIASREADYLVGMANGGLINRHSYLVDAQSGRAWGEVAEGNRPERVVPANTATALGAVPDVMGSESLMYRTFDAAMFRMEKAIEKLGDRIERMRILMDGQDVGQIVTPHVSQEIAVAVTSTAGGPH